MSDTVVSAFWKNFLGPSPVWYKQTIVAFLLLNPFILLLAGPFVTGWLLIAEFIFTLALALRCYPLQPGGLLAIEAVLLGMTTPESVYHETLANFEVILLLMFMVAGIYFMKELLLFVFTRILLSVKSKVVLSLLFSLVAAVPVCIPGCTDGDCGADQRGRGFLLGLPQGGVRQGFSQDDHDHSQTTACTRAHREDLETVPGLSAQPADARCRGHRTGRRLHPGR